MSGKAVEDVINVTCHNFWGRHSYETARPIKIFFLFMIGVKIENFSLILELHLKLVLHKFNIPYENLK